MSPAETVPTVDFAHTRTAEQNRLAKAAALAAVARRLGVDAAGLAVGTGNRRRVWHEAGLKRAPSEDTWLAVVDVLGLPRASRALPVPAGRCLFHPDRPAHLYLGGYRCDHCSPAALAGRVVPVPPAGTTAADLLAARGSRELEDLEPWIREARKASPAHRHGTAASRARLAQRVYLRGLHNPGPAP